MKYLFIYSFIIHSNSRCNCLL